MSNIDQALKIIVDTITTIGNPDKIILFGSQARGDANENSDIDIMVIEDDLSRESQLNYLKRIYQDTGHQVSVDLVFKDTNTMARESKMSYSLVNHVLSEGVSLYEC